MDKRYADFFKPGTYPEMTYVSRISKETKYTYEERLQQSLSIDGYLTYIVGPSKIGKTVLCEKVIGQESMVSMSGSDFVKENDFWFAIGKKIGLSMSAQISEKNSDYSEHENRATVITKDYLGNKDRVIEYFKVNAKVLVLDDFHYAPSDTQYDIACQLKEVMRLGFKTVIISLPYRSDDAIRLNPDLTGRISVIEISPWEEDELKQIAQKGFQQLKIGIKEEIITKMAMESIHSPQLMQAICLNVGLLPENFSIITEDVIEESCRFTCMNLPYADVVRVLKAGPPTRGQNRLKYELHDDSQRDIYSLILKIIADNPPNIELCLDDIMNRIQQNIIEGKITTKKVKDSLKNWNKILESMGVLYHVFEWKDDVLHILDNLFLFYIRWTDR